MKILCILENNPFPQSNAPANRFISLIKGLASYSWQVDLIFVNGYTEYKESKEFNVNGKYLGFNYFYLLSYIKKNKILNKVLNRIIPTSFYVNRIYNKILIDKYDYVWIGVSVKLVKIGCELFKLKLPVKYIHERSEFSWISINEDRIHKLYLSYFLSNIDIMIVMTKTLIEYYKKYIPDKSIILHLPMTVDFSRFVNIVKMTYQFKQPYIGYCGTMNSKKDGVDILVNSFINIMRNYPDFTLYLAGPLEPSKDYLKLLNMIKAHNAEDRIIFLGTIKKEGMPFFLKNASILALARPGSKQSEGGFPTKLGEYLATGNPVCVTNIGEIGNYLTHGVSAFIADSDSVASFTNILNNAIVSPDSYEIGQKGKKVAFENFNKDIQSKKLSDFLIKNLK